MCDQEIVLKVHSAVRWGKTVDEIKAVLNDDAQYDFIFHFVDENDQNRARNAYSFICNTSISKIFVRFSTG